MGPVWRLKFFNARTTVPDPISSYCAIALTLMPRRAQSDNFLAVEYFSGTPTRCRRSVFMGVLHDSPSLALATESP
jgi:hypothetical protein